jgi:hypothetical protein
MLQQVSAWWLWGATRADSGTGKYCICHTKFRPMVSSSHQTHPKDAACGSQNSMRRALNAATMHVSAAAKTWQPTAANAHSYKTVNPLKSMVCQGQPTAATP